MKTHFAVIIMAIKRMLENKVHLLDDSYSLHFTCPPAPRWRIGLVST